MATRDGMEDGLTADIVTFVLTGLSMARFGGKNAMANIQDGLRVRAGSLLISKANKNGGDKQQELKY